MEFVHFRSQHGDRQTKKDSSRRPPQMVLRSSPPTESHHPDTRPQSTARTSPTPFTCGTVVLKKTTKNTASASGKARATMFFIAYTRDGVKDPAKASVAFIQWGCPGLPSVWLHLGVLGPKASPVFRRHAPPGRKKGGTPCKLVDNRIFPAGRNRSGVTTPWAPATAAGCGEKPEVSLCQRDLDERREFIRLYTSRNERWAAPKFSPANPTAPRAPPAFLSSAGKIQPLPERP